MENNRGLKLKGFGNIEWHKIILRTLIEKECAISFNVLDSFRTFFIGRAIVYNSDLISSSKILCFQSYYQRGSYNAQMDAFRHLYDMDLIRGSEKKSLYIHGFGFLFSHIIPWYKALKKYDVPKLTAIRVLAQLSQLYELYKLLLTIDVKKYSLLVTFCDSIIDEGMATEYFKNKGIKTASLQHGQYTAWRCNEFINSGVELRTLKSDYLLAWNQMTKDEASKQGVAETKIVITGILGNIGRNYERASVHNNGVFGVVINHPSFENDNISLIQAANYLAKEKNLKYYLKLHPSYSDDYFANLIDSDYYIGNIKKGIEILDYANMCDFSIASSSSVFCELVYVGHRVLRFSSLKVDDKFRDVPYGATFNTPGNIVKCFDNGFKEEDEDKLFSYLCGVRDATQEYSNFIKSIVN